SPALQVSALQKFPRALAEENIRFEIRGFLLELRDRSVVAQNRSGHDETQNFLQLERIRLVQGAIPRRRHELGIQAMHRQQRVLHDEEGQFRRQVFDAVGARFRQQIHAAKNDEGRSVLQELILRQVLGIETAQKRAQRKIKLSGKRGQLF